MGGHRRANWPWESQVEDFGVRVFWGPVGWVLTLGSMYICIYTGISIYVHFSTLKMEIKKPYIYIYIYISQSTTFVVRVKVMS